MKAIKMTPAEVKADEKRNYNPSAWEKVVDAFLKYSDVAFYKIPPQGGYGYDRFLVVYTLPEGLRLMGEVSYSSMLSSGGFAEAFIFETDDKGDALPIGEAIIKIKRNVSRYNNTQEARKYMTNLSKKYNDIFTKL
jgi:hypothetical protein